MMKRFYFLMAVHLLSVVSYGQFFSDLDWQKQKIPAVLTTVSYNQEITKDAILLRMGQLGLSASQEKGAILYKSATLPEVGPDVYDLLFKVDKKGRGESATSEVYFAVSRGNNNYVKASDTDSLPASMKKFCVRFGQWAEAQALELDIKAQEERVKQLQRKLQSLTDDSVQLEKKMQKIQLEIIENKLAIEKQKLDVDIQGKTLEALLRKRKL